VTPLRQITRGSVERRRVPLQAGDDVRVRNDTDFDTPFPPEMTHGDNPPDGAILNYYLKSAPPGRLPSASTIRRGKLVRELTSVPPPPEPEPQLNVPNYWIERPHPLTRGGRKSRGVGPALHAANAIGPYGTGAYPISALIWRDASGTARSAGGAGDL
jgi:hypothetical protein